MPSRILRLFLICFLVAGVLNLANFLVCYYSHRKNYDPELIEWDIIPESTTELWDFEMSTWLICGENVTNCPNKQSEMSKIEASVNNQTTKKYNGFYYYVQDTDLSKTRICPNVPSGLGPIEEIDGSLLELNAFDEMFAFIKLGGWFKPTQCIPRQSTAIIVPMLNETSYSAQKNYIGIFVFYIHLFLMKQLQEYRLFIVLQAGDPKAHFRRCKLLNIGYIEAQTMRKNGWDCLVFHDMYYVPTDSRNLYRCTRQPRRLLATNNTEDLQKFGGVVAIRPTIFNQVNGFSNLNWYNDDDYVNMYQRLQDWNYTIENASLSVGKFTTLQYYPHINLSRPEQQSDNVHATTPIHLIDGLSSLSYKVIHIEIRPLFTLIEVDLNSQE